MLMKKGKAPIKIDANPFPQMTVIASAKFKIKNLINNLCAQCKQDIENGSFD